MQNQGLMKEFVANALQMRAASVSRIAGTTVVVLAASLPAPGPGGLQSLPGSVRGALRVSGQPPY